MAKYVGLSSDEFTRMMGALTDMDLKIREERHHCALQGISTDNSWGIEAGIVLPTTAQSVEQKLAEGRAYQRRMSARAGEVLNARQVEQFSQIQEDWLNSVRQGWDFQAKGTQPVTRSLAIGRVI